MNWRGAMTGRVGRIACAVLLNAMAIGAPARSVVGTDDPRGDYQSADFKTRSRSIEGHDGVAADLLTLANAPPLGLPAIPVPAGNPMTLAKIALGRKLFFDRRLSGNGTLSCAMCHVPEQGFTQHELRTPVGVEGRFVKRNAPALYNVAYRTSMFLDGRETSLENQVWSPLLAVNEMANPSIGSVLTRIEQAADYEGLFEGSFGRGPSMETVGMALAAYERALLSAASPFDRWYFDGDANALSDAAQRGFGVFKASACNACHLIDDAYVHFTDEQFHDTGIGYYHSMLRETSNTESNTQVTLAPGVVVQVENTFARPHSADLGRYEATGRVEDRWRFRTPTLRNVAITAPYMHDGSLATLREVIETYNAGGVPHDGQDPRIRPLGLSEGDIGDLVAFLQSLTGSNVDALARDARSVPIGDHTH